MKFLESVHLAIAFCGQLIRRGYPVALFNRTTRNVVLDCLNVCCREDKSKLWECLKTNRVVISKTPRAGDVTVISRSSWIAPQFIKMNTDGAFSLLNGESGGVVVFRGCSAHVLKDLSIRFGRLCSPRSAEFETLHIGLTEAIKLGYLTPILEMDCLPIVQAIQGKRPLLDEERKAVSSLPFHCLKDYSIVMTPREANSLADVLARTGLSGSTKMERDRALYSAHLVEQEDALRETRFRLRWPETVANERDVQQPPVVRTLVLAGEAQKEEIRDGANSTNNVSGAGIDLSSLSTVEGKVCWDLYIDGLVVGSDGNLLDAWVLPTFLSRWVEMESPTIPVPHIMVIDQYTCHIPKRNTGIPVVVTLTKVITLLFFHKWVMANTGIPKVHVAASASSDGQPEVDVSDEEFLQFDTSGVPVVFTLTKVITLVFFHKWVMANILWFIL
ncbi:hypothetical protein RHGRI_006268 [Rhododendron griersonianum]|uniref:RNase H type-1 domain-containing protein n=1 Tax=Rhododendron griersonianum TaxID=479676 RepID=A0AAV6KSG9_9ERIC|nr:hypothetical protein RHGRI_006268 [Rhododendron griersonianum]